VLYINVQTASYDPRSNMLSGSVWNEIFKNLKICFYVFRLFKYIDIKIIFLNKKYLKKIIIIILKKYINKKY